MFKDKLKEARKAAGLTQKEVAEAIGVSESAYCGYETGKRQPDVMKLKQIARVLGTTSDYLIETNFQNNADDVELAVMLEQLKTRPEMRMLFKLTADATVEDVRQAVRIIEAIRRKE